MKTRLPRMRSDSEISKVPTPQQPSSTKRLFITLLCLVCCNFGQAATTEVWVKWGAATAGSGTMADPKVVSTSTDFDNYMNAQGSDTTIHLLAGTFLTRSAIVAD